MKKILLQLDTDDKTSVFDQIVAYDAGVDQVIAISGVNPKNVQAQVHGAMFTRGGKDLCNTAIFVGGSDVDLGQQVFYKACDTFFGPVRVSVMMDANGSNTTAAAAVRRITKGREISGKKAVVLAGTGPVGVKTAILLAKEGCEVSITSRTIQKAKNTCDHLKKDWGISVTPYESNSQEELASIMDGVEIVVAAGGAGLTLLTEDLWKRLPKLEVLADVNAVPPLGIEGSEVMDNGREREGKSFFGAIAIGNLKMKIHRRSIQTLFESNDQVLNLEQIYTISREY